MKYFNKIHNNHRLQMQQKGVELLLCYQLQLLPSYSSLCTPYTTLQSTLFPAAIICCKFWKGHCVHQGITWWNTQAQTADM